MLYRTSIIPPRFAISVHALFLYDQFKVAVLQNRVSTLTYSEGRSILKISDHLRICAALHHSKRIFISGKHYRWLILMSLSLAVWIFEHRN